MNFKITTSEDYQIAKLIAKIIDEGFMIRIGQGFDIHRL